MSWITTIANAAKSILKPKTMPVDQFIPEAQFADITKMVIDSLEGGYYHPRMKAGFNARSQAAFGDSGETMFGLDRKHGAQLSSSPDWAVFWDICDQHSKNWGYNDRGGDQEVVLRELAAKIMFPWFLQLAVRYLSAPAKAALLEDKRLLFHFSYASWNGEHWFKRFAGVLNEAAKKQGQSKQELFEAAIKARTQSGNAVIRQQGVNMLAAFRKYHL